MHAVPLFQKGPGRISLTNFFFYHIMLYRVHLPMSEILPLMVFHCRILLYCYTVSFLHVKILAKLCNNNAYHIVHV
jgi:hypothetical protein